MNSIDSAHVSMIYFVLLGPQSHPSLLLFLGIEFEHIFKILVGFGKTVVTEFVTLISLRVRKVMKGFVMVEGHFFSPIGLVLQNCLLHSLIIDLVSFDELS